MKLGTKLISAFIVVALVLVVVASVSFVLRGNMTESQENMDGKYDEVDDINQLVRGLYEEHRLAVEYITTEDPTEAELLLDEKEVLYQENEDSIDEFLEKGKYNPSLKLAHDVAKALKTTIDELFIFDNNDEEQ